jgi:propane monooxygenase reductase subunit
MVTEVLTRLETDLHECDVYLCGPPPMIDAALPLLTDMDVPESQIFYDKFTITAAAE